MRVRVVKSEKFFIVIEVLQRVFDENTINDFEKIFDKELDQACSELRQEAKRKFNEIKQSANGDSETGGSDPRISDR